MKAHLGHMVFEVTPEQMEGLNAAAEKEWHATQDRAKGLVAAIDYCKKAKCKVIKGEVEKEETKK